MARPSRTQQIKSAQPVPGSPISGPRLEKVTALLAALADPTRLKIISVLAETEQNVGELAKLLNKTESAISHQLRILRDAHLVSVRRTGRNAYYGLIDQHIVMIYQQLISHVDHQNFDSFSQKG